MTEKKGFFANLFGKKEEEVKQTAEQVKEQAEVAAENAKRAADAARRKAETEAKAAEYEARKKAAEAEEAAKKLAEEAKAAAEEKAKEVKESLEAKKEALQEKLEEQAAKKAILDTYTVAQGDTLSHIALRFYGHATPPYYKLIYEFNKDVIGENMNIVVPGQVLNIPVLPEELK